MKKILLPAAVAVLSLSISATETPTMGWSSWNTYRVNISDSLIMSQADAMVYNGLRDAGYRYINIDDGYFGGRDEATGSLKFHPTRFPRGLKPVVDHIHSLGLKAGIYSDAGANTCGNYWDKDTIARNVGLYRHEYRDCEMFFNELGFDFIKVDFCGGDAPQNTQRYSLDPQQCYTKIAEAIKATGRDDVRLNVCRWNYPGTWVSDVATSWRTTHDIYCAWESVRDIIAENLYLSAYAGNGRYNDMDMLEIGRTLSDEEDRTHFGMWCIMASPLLIGCDMTTLSPLTLDLLKNPELIALNQDKLGLQAYVVKPSGGGYILVKDIENPEGLTRAVAFYNPTDTTVVMTLDFEEIQLSGKVASRDLYERKDLPKRKNGMTVEVPPHGTRIYRLEGEGRLHRTRYEAETAYLTSYQEIYNPQVLNTPEYVADSRCSNGVKVTRTGVTPINDLLWKNVRCSEAGEYELTVGCLSPEKREFFISVNGGDGYKLKVPGGDEVVSVSVKMPLKAGVNSVRLYNDRELMPDIDFLDVKPLQSVTAE